MKPFTLDVPTWYATIVGALVVVLLLYRAISRLTRLLEAMCTFYLLKYLIYPVISRRTPYMKRMTRIYSLAALLYVAVNILCMTLYSESTNQIGIRAGIMSTANLILLLPGPLSRVADCLGVSLQTQTQVHGCIGILVLLQGLVHTAILLVSRQAFRLNTPGLFGSIGISLLALVNILALQIFRHVVFEIFSWSHVIFSPSILVSLWFHVSPQKTTSRIYIVVGAGVWLVSNIYRWIHLVLRNFSWAKPRTMAKITPVSGALQVEVSISRPWSVKAGQYIYLIVPRAGFWSLFQRHPFMVSGWTGEPGKLKVYLLIQPRKDFTRRLSELTDDLVPAFIEGPYGRSHNFSEFGTVLMLATGIGIAGHLPYIKELVQGYKQCRVKTRVIVLIWRLDHDGQKKLAKSIVNKLLEDNVAKYLVNIEIYVPNMNMPAATTGRGQRIITFHYEPDFEDIILESFQKQGGKMVISLCTNLEITANVRGLVSRNLPNDVCLVEIDFKPPDNLGLEDMQRRLSFQCKGL